jgi:hypothetical protein
MRPFASTDRVETHEVKPVNASRKPEASYPLPPKKKVWEELTLCKESAVFLLIFIGNV